MHFLLGWLAVLSGGCAGLLAVAMLLKGLWRAVLETDGDDTFMHLLTAFWGAVVGGGSCAGLISLGAFLLGWKWL